MATLALFAIGSAIGGALAPTAAGAVAFGLTGAAIGGFLGGSLGSLIDSAFLFPAIFGQESISGPRLGDQPVMTGQVGSPMHWVIGPKNRVGTTVIWKSDLIEVKKKKKVGKGGGTSVTSFKYFVDIALGVCDTTDIPGNAVKGVTKIYADTKLIYDSSNTFPDKYDSVTIYDGSQSITDPLIVSYEGEENTPAYRRLCYIVINRLALDDYGNRIPNINVVVEQANPFTLQEGVSLIMQRAGYATADFVVNRLDQCLNGYNLSGPQQMARALAPLMLAFTINVQERDQIINFMPKGDEDQIVIENVGDLAAHTPGEDPPRPLDTVDVDDFDIPSEVVVRFSDHTHDLEQGSQRQVRWDHVAQNRVTLDLPVALHPDEALNIAKRMLWSAEAERQRVFLSLPPSYIGLREGMSLLVPNISGRSREVWVRRVSIGNDYRIEVEGVFYQPDTYNVDSDLDDTSVSDDVYKPPATTLYIADLPNLSTKTEDKVGLYYVVAATDSTARWRGAELWRSSNNSNYDLEESVPTEGVIGITKLGYINPDAAPFRWDRTTELTVQVYEAGLETVSEEDVLDGSNRIAVKTQTGEYEIMAFSTATLVSPLVYKLTNLLRGLRGTAHLIREHGPFDQPFVLADSAVSFVERQYGDNTYWKAPSIGGLLSDFDSQEVLVRGRNLQPFSPWNFKGVYVPNVNNPDRFDLVLSWTRRMKYIRGLFASKPLPDDETPETYEADIILGNDPVLGIIKRTIQVQGQTTITYDNDTMITDGFASNDIGQIGKLLLPVSANIYQISQIYGRSPYQFGVFKSPSL